MNASLFSLFPAPVLCLGRMLCCSKRLPGVRSDSLLHCQPPIKPQADPFASAGLRSEAAPKPVAVGANVLRLLKHQVKGESSAFSLTRLKPLHSQRYSKVLRQVKRQWQSLVFTY